MNEPGWYSIEINNYKCNSNDSVYVEFEDCEVRLVMPNVFSPNGDDFNQTFLPIESNYIDSGTVIIYNRWGEKLFFGDVFQGWDGKSNDKKSSSGVYYYDIYLRDQNGKRHTKRGTVTLIR